MTVPILICDDSSFARKQMARALPEDWDVEIHFAKNGHEALDKIKAGNADLLFLDLNMPVLDGFATLEEIRRQELNTIIIVVSADIQEATREKVINLGALDFVAKPIDKHKTNEILKKYGILDELVSKKSRIGLSDEMLDLYREITNVSMGQAAELLGKYLNASVILSIPVVNTMQVNDLHKTLQLSEENNTYTAVVQGFIGAGISGEALLIFNDSCFKDISELMQIKQALDDELEQELSIDISNILIGACLKSIGTQIDILFSQGCPTLLGQHQKISNLIKSPKFWEETLSIEIDYKIENYNINCELLLLFTENTVPKLNAKVSCLL